MVLSTNQRLGSSRKSQVLWIRTILIIVLKLQVV